MIRITPAPTLVRGVSRLMSIDKESSGFPEVNVHRATTKVNLWMIAGILLFLVVAGAAAFWSSRQAVVSTGVPQSVTDKK